MSQEQGKLDALISAWLDERISDAESQILQQQLRESSHARELFLRYAGLDASIRQSADLDSQLFRPCPNPSTNQVDRTAKRPVVLWIVAVAVCAVSVFALTLAMKDATSRSIARISGISGPFRYTGDAGRVSTELTVGQRIAGGTIDGLSPDSWFEFEFEDGSSLTLSGNSMLAFSDDGQKVLHLKSGKLAAKVKKQPLDQPMMIHTRSATLTVLGTSFDVEADLPSTTVNVSEGLVRVVRTSDGKRIEVPAKHRVVAGADQEFVRRLVPDVVYRWKSRLDRGPVEAFGQWTPAVEGRPAMLKSVAFRPEEAPDVVLYLLGMRVQSMEGSPVLLQSDSRFEIRGKLNLQTEIYLGCSVTDLDGDFAGKFLAKCDVSRDDSGDFIAVASLGDFALDPSVQAHKEHLASSPSNLIIDGTWCFTHSKSPSGLQVSEIELLPSEVSLRGGSNAN